MNVSTNKAGFGTRDWGLKSSQTQPFVRTRIANFKKLFSHCVLLAPSFQPLASELQV
jgi:hypothetical protein